MRNIFTAIVIAIITVFIFWLFLNQKTEPSVTVSVSEHRGTLRSQKSEGNDLKKYSTSQPQALDWLSKLGRKTEPMPILDVFYVRANFDKVRNRANHGDALAAISLYYAMTECIVDNYAHSDSLVKCQPPPNDAVTPLHWLKLATHLGDERSILPMLDVVQYNTPIKKDPSYVESTSAEFVESLLIMSAEGKIEAYRALSIMYNSSDFGEKNIIKAYVYGNIYGMVAPSPEILAYVSALRKNMRDSDFEAAHDMEITVFNNLKIR